MEARKPLDVIGWLGSVGYRIVVDEPARTAEEAAKENHSSKQSKKINPKEIGVEE